MNRLTPTQKTAKRFAALITGKFDCPFCGNHGPHDDNGMTGEEQTFCCYKCGAHIDADMVEVPAR
jgi:transcription elongation factor Elf1